MEIVTVTSYDEVPKFMTQRYLTATIEEAAAAYHARFGVLPERGYRLQRDAKRSVYIFHIPEGADVPDFSRNMV